MDNRNHRLRMDNLSKDGGECDESDQFSESFVCCVCLDLLYKPIVLLCGHISCFWCIHNSMNGVRESHCPMCRHPYYHFPTVCKILHSVLLKMYPVAYKRRENQTLEQEKKTGVFSPQFVSIPCGLHPNQESNFPSNHVHTLAKSFQPDLQGNKKEVPCANGTTKLNLSCNANIEVTKVGHPEEENFPQNSPLENHRRISLADAQCVACSELLFRPVVVNCGHVYCEPCIINLGEGKLTCQVCQSILPRGSPKVCLVLNFLLEKEFSNEYSMRKATLQHKKPCLQSPTSCSTEASQIVVPSSFLSARDYHQLWSVSASNVHAGVGCDCCGMLPINGDRYKCRDCVEQIGFDLCGECYKTPSKLLGRFNQQHTLEHRFELIRSEDEQYA